MESGLDGRNNPHRVVSALPSPHVSMESGLDGRNNGIGLSTPIGRLCRLNGVRPRWPEQLVATRALSHRTHGVSMESGLVGRNNSYFDFFDIDFNQMSQWSPA